MKCHVLVGVYLDGGVGSIQIESVIGAFPLGYVGDLQTAVNDLLSELDIYDGEDFDDVQGYAQLTLHGKLVRDQGTHTYNPEFSVVDSFYSGYL